MLDIAAPNLRTDGNFVLSNARENTAPLRCNVRRRRRRRKEVLKRDACVKHGSIRTTQFDWYVGTARHFRPQRSRHDDQTPSSDLEEVFDFCEPLHSVLSNV